MFMLPEIKLIKEFNGVEERKQQFVGNICR